MVTGNGKSGGRQRPEKLIGKTLRTVFDNWDLPVLLISKFNQIIYANNEAVRTLKIESLPAYLNTIFSPENSAKFLQLIDRFSLSTESELKERYELVLQEDNVLFLAELYPLFSRKTFTGILLILRDINSLQKAQQDMLNILDKLTETFKEPLTTIKGFVETLLDGAYMDRDVTREFLKVIDRETNKMIRLLIEVRRYLSIGQEPKLELTELEPHSFFKLVLQPFLERAVSKNIKFRWELQPNLPKLVADPEKLRIVMYNVLDNAFKFSTYRASLQEGYKPEVYLEVGFHRDTFTITVEDNGIGVPESEFRFLGARFFKASNARDVYGIGLGLAVSVELIRLHGGEVEFSRSKLGGLKVSLTLPYREKP